MKLKIKNPISMGFMFIFSIVCISLPYCFYSGNSMLEKKEYIWFLYFNLIFMFLIIFMLSKSYSELIRAEIREKRLFYHNFLFIKKSVELSQINGYKTGRDDNGNNLISLYSNENKRLFILKDNYYSNIPEFVEKLQINNLGIEFTVFQKIILKLKGKNKDQNSL